MANTNIPCPGYPTSAWGSTKVWRGDHFGPALYATGGEVMSASSFTGVGGLEVVKPEFGGFAYSNNYYVKVVPPANSASSAQSYAPTWNGSNNTTQMVLQWFIASNNAQVAANTNLTAEAVRLEVFGV